jgi:hypothetical protein
MGKMRGVRCLNGWTQLAQTRSAKARGGRAGRLKTKQIIVFGVGGIAELAGFSVVHDSETRIPGLQPITLIQDRSKFLGRRGLAFEQVGKRFQPSACVAISCAKHDKVRRFHSRETARAMTRMHQDKSPTNRQELAVWLMNLHFAYRFYAEKTAIGLNLRLVFETYRSRTVLRVVLVAGNLQFRLDFLQNFCCLEISVVKRVK